MVTLVFVDRTLQTVSDAEATRMCKSLEIAGTIIDALTPDKHLQNQLRVYMDNLEE